MSASLVGSEMCIRDRAEVAPALPAALEQWGLLRMEVPDTHYVGSRGSVSYTHLTLPTICSV
eukprot:11773480-Alexandrium_andersonii.AAC.1